MLSFGSTDGHSNRFTFADNDTLDSVNWYVHAFFFELLTVCGAQRFLAGKGSDAATVDGHYLSLNTSEQFLARHRAGGGGADSSASAAPLTVDAAVHSIVIAHAEVPGYERFYRDGILDVERSFSSNIGASADGPRWGSIAASTGVACKIGHAMLWSGQQSSTPLAIDAVDSLAAQFHAGQVIPLPEHLLYWIIGLDDASITNELTGEVATKTGTVTFVANAVDSYFTGAALPQHLHAATHRLMGRTFDDHRHSLRVPLHFLKLDLMRPFNLSHDSLLRSASHLSDLDARGVDPSQLFDRWRRQLVVPVGITCHHREREVTLSFIDQEKLLATYFCSEKIIGATANHYPGISQEDVGGNVTAERSTRGFLPQENNLITTDSNGTFIREVSPSRAKRSYQGLLCEDAVTNKVVNPAFASGLTSWTSATAGGGTVTAATNRLALPATVSGNSIEVVGAAASENSFRQVFAMLTANGHARLMFIHSDRQNVNPNWKVERDFDTKRWDDATATWVAGDTWNSTPAAWDAVNGLEIGAVFWSKPIPIGQNENWTVRIGKLNVASTHNFYLVNLTDGKLRYSPLINTTITDVDVVKDVLDAGTAFDERYEASGYDETWSAAVVVDGGNTYDPDADPADVSSPSLWGNRCLKAVQVTNPNAYRIHSAGELASFFTRAEIVVDSSGVTPGSSFPVFTVVTLAASSLFGLRIFSNDGTLTWRLEEISNGSSNHILGPQIVLGQRYLAELNWDFANLAWEWRMDGEVIASGAITDSTPEMAAQIQVGIRSSLAAGSTVYFDNVAIDDFSYPELAGRQLHCSQHGTLEVSMLAEQDVNDMVLGARHVLLYVQIGTSGKDYDALVYEKPSSGAARFTYERWRDVSGTSTLDARALIEIDIVRGTLYHVSGRSIGADLELGLAPRTMRVRVNGQNGADVVAAALLSASNKHSELWVGSAPAASGFKRAMNYLYDVRAQARVITDEETRT